MKTESITNLAKALVQAQAEMPVVKMNSSNPFLKYKYADLGAILTTVKPVLAKFKLAVTQFPSEKNGLMGLTTILLHESGEFIEEFSFIPVEHSKGLSAAQSAGVAQTYMRRYGIASVLGLFADEDPDGSIQPEQNVGTKPEKVDTAERVWSIDAMEKVIEANVGVEDHVGAARVLNMSVLPDTAPLKTIESWLKKFAASEAPDELGCAHEANQAYMKAKKAGK